MIVQGQRGSLEIATFGNRLLGVPTSLLQTELDGLRGDRLPRQAPEDLGFRVFKLAPSNFKPWVGVEEKDAQAYAQQMELFRDPLVEGWTVAGGLAELAAKPGFGLDYQAGRCASYSPEGEWPGGDFYQVMDRAREQTFYACLAPRLPLQAVESLGLKADDLFICRDAALDDETAANLALQCRLETI